MIRRRIHNRYVMRGPRQIIPGPIPTRSHATGASTAAAAGVATDAPPLEADQQPLARRLLYRHHAKSRQPKNPRTIASRSHAFSLAGCTTKENGTRLPRSNGIALSPLA